MATLSVFWSDDRGFIVSVEMIIIVTMVVIGLIVGLSCLQSAVIWEFKDIAFALNSLDQSYRFNGYRGCKGAFVNGSFYWDRFGRLPVATGLWGADVGVGGRHYGYGLGTGTGVVGGGAAAESAPVAPAPEVCPPMGTSSDIPCPPGVPYSPPATTLPGDCTDCGPAAESFGPLAPHADPSYPPMFVPGQ